MCFAREVVEMPGNKRHRSFHRTLVYCSCAKCRAPSATGHSILWIPNPNPPHAKHHLHFVSVHTTNHTNASSFLEFSGVMSSRTTTTTGCHAVFSSPATTTPYNTCILCSVLGCVKSAAHRVTCEAEGVPEAARAIVPKPQAIVMSGNHWRFDLPHFGKCRKWALQDAVRNDISRTFAVSSSTSFKILVRSQNGPGVAACRRVEYYTVPLGSGSKETADNTSMNASLPLAMRMTAQTPWP